jgi:branched-chain amino acid aminotransferase
MDTYYVDGQFVADDKAFICARDIVVLRGFGVFDFLITYKKRPFYLNEHVERLEYSARQIGLELKHSNAEICAIAEETLMKNPHHDESNIRIVYTGGVSSDGVTPEGKGILMVMVTPRHIPPEWWYNKGTKIVTVDFERFMPEAKSTNYINAIYALQMAKKQGGVEALYVDSHNRILECTTSNFFFFKAGKLVTSYQDILPGVTRNVILEIAGNHFEIETRDIDRSEINQMEEAFITASNKEVAPVVMINDLQIGDGQVGENTKKIMQIFRDYTKAYGERKI